MINYFCCFFQGQNMILKYKYSTQKPIQEGIITSTVVTGTFFLGLLVLGHFASKAKKKQARVLQAIAKCFDNDYVTIEVSGKELKQIPVHYNLTFRHRELQRLISKKHLVLVFNKKAFAYLRSAFSDLEIFTKPGTKEYTIDEFVEKFEPYFGTFGEYRKNVNIERKLTLFKSIDIEKASPCVQLNLSWIGVLLRQLILHGKELGIEKVKVKTKRILLTEIY